MKVIRRLPHRHDRDSCTGKTILDIETVTGFKVNTFDTSWPTSIWVEHLILSWYKLATKWWHEETVSALLTLCNMNPSHYSDVIMRVMAFQIAIITIVCSAFCSDKWKHQSSAPLAIVKGPKRWIPSQRVGNAGNISLDDVNMSLMYFRNKGANKRSFDIFMSPWTNCWTNCSVAGDLRRNGTYVPSLLWSLCGSCLLSITEFVELLSLSN